MEKGNSTGFAACSNFSVGRVVPNGWAAMHSLAREVITNANDVEKGARWHAHVCTAVNLHDAHDT